MFGTQCFSTTLHAPCLIFHRTAIACSPLLLKCNLPPHLHDHHATPSSSGTPPCAQAFPETAPHTTPPAELPGMPHLRPGLCSASIPFHHSADCPVPQCNIRLQADAGHMYKCTWIGLLTAADWPATRCSRQASYSLLQTGQQAQVLNCPAAMPVQTTRMSSALSLQGSRSRILQLNLHDGGSSREGGSKGGRCVGCPLQHRQLAWGQGWHRLQERTCCQSHVYHHLRHHDAVMCIKLGLRIAGRVTPAR
jgi:hypothetical protein